MKKIVVVFQLSMLMASINVFSQQTQNPIIAKFLLEGGIEYGGDEILKVFFTNGGDQSMKAGQGGFLAIGGQLQFAKVKFLLLRATIGIKYNTTAAENANIRLTRLPINLIPYLKINDDFRLGIGISSHQSVILKGDGFFPDVDFTSSLGPRVEFGYKWVAVSYTAISYTKGTTEKFSANSLGVSVSFTLPQDE